MPVYTKVALSASTSGRPIEVQGTSSPGTTIHTMGTATGGTPVDEVWLWCCNLATTDGTLTVEFGGTSSEDRIMTLIPSRAGPLEISSGWPVTATSAIVRAYATATAIMVISGFANRIRAA